MDKWGNWKKQTSDLRQKTGYDKEAPKEFVKGFTSKDNDEKKQNKKFWRLSGLLTDKLAK